MPKLKLVGFPLSDTDYEYFISTCLLVICVFLNLMREKVTQIQETQRVPIQRNPTSLTSRHIIIKMAKFQDKGRILKAAKQNKPGSNIQGSLDKVTSWLLNGNALSQNGMARNIPSNENQGPSIKMEGQISSFLDKRSHKVYTSSKPALPEMLKGLL